MTAYDKQLRLLTLEGKTLGALNIQQRIRERCMELPDAASWAFTTGLIIGQYLKELEEEKKENQ